MNKIVKIYTQLLKAEITGTSVSEEILGQITPEIKEQLYHISRKNDLAHVIAAVLQRNNLLGEDELSAKYSKVLYKAVMRYENIRYEFGQICSLFEEEKIVYVPLKGSVIRTFYAEPWLRTSNDIDILIRPEDLDRACELLHTRLNYYDGILTTKDLSLFSPSGVHLELHFKIQESMEKMDRVFCNLWDYIEPVKENEYRYKMTPEYFLFHIVAHIAKHMLHGGCGVRAYVDVWLLMKHLQYDENIFLQLCEESELRHFVESMRKLLNVWFEEEEHDELSRQLERYVIDGGTFGTEEMIMTTKRMNASGGSGYILKRIFMPYKDLCTLYPKLVKLPVLYPVYTVVRWCKLLNLDVFKRVTNEAQVNSAIAEDKVDELKDLFEKLQLSK